VSASGPRFDESLASAARNLHVGEISVAALLAAAVLFVWLERRGRREWARVPRAMLEAAQGPYRSSALVRSHLLRAPRLVRAAAFASLVLCHVFVPLIALALLQYPFDGIAIPLVPGMALVVLNWACAWMLLGRSPNAPSAARSGAVGSLIAHVGLLGIAAVHLVTVELQRRDGIEHACSSSVTFVVIVFAVASVAQALVTTAALRAHEAALVWSEERSPAE
jgi:hypothetical protein